MLLFFFFIVTYGRIPPPGHLSVVDRQIPGDILPRRGNTCPPGEKFDTRLRKCIAVSCKSPRACPKDKKCESFASHGYPNHHHHRHRQQSDCIRPPCKLFECVEIPTCPPGEKLSSFTGICQPITCQSPIACPQNLVCKPADIFCVVGPCPQFECIEPCPLGEKIDSYTGVCEPITCESPNACPQDLLCEPVNLDCIVSPCPQFECVKPLLLPVLEPIDCPLHLPEPFSSCTIPDLKCEYDILTCCSGTSQEERYAISSADCVHNSWQIAYFEISCSNNCGEKNSLMSIECPLDLPKAWSICHATVPRCDYGTITCCSGTSQEVSYVTSYAECHMGMWHISMPYILCPEDCGVVLELIPIISIAEKPEPFEVWSEISSGLRYRVIKSGTGRKVALNDVILGRYKGFTLNNQEFISSEDISKVSDWIKGMQEALLLMEEGGIYQIYLPSELAYGPEGNFKLGIGSNEDLWFEYELLKLNP